MSIDQNIITCILTNGPVCKCTFGKRVLILSMIFDILLYISFLHLLWNISTNLNFPILLKAGSSSRILTLKLFVWFGDSKDLYDYFIEKNTKLSTMRSSMKAKPLMLLCQPGSTWATTWYNKHCAVVRLNCRKPSKERKGRKRKTKKTNRKLKRMMVWKVHAHIKFGFKTKK